MDQAIAAINALDLGLIKFKACRGEDGYGWTAAYAERMEIAYKRYLILHLRHPQLTLAPEQDVDRFWHLHILDTRKYAADCEACFGYFLHHFPYLGLRGEADAAALQTAFLSMQALYAQEFGEPVPALQHDAAWCSIDVPPAKAAWCSFEPPAAKAAWCSFEPPVARPAWCSIEPTALAQGSSVSAEPPSARRAS